MSAEDDFEEMREEDENINHDEAKSNKVREILHRLGFLPEKIVTKAN